MEVPSEQEKVHDVNVTVEGIELLLDMFIIFCIYIASPGASNVEQLTKLREENSAREEVKLAK